MLLVLIFDLIGSNHILKNKNRIISNSSSVQNYKRRTLESGDSKKNFLLNISRPPTSTIISDYGKIDSIKQLSRIFHNKLILIDLWATWCPACFDEFKYNKSLHSFLKEKKVPLVYISFDEDTLDNSWRKAILKENLVGSHIRASKKLKDDICVHIWRVKNAFSIPHLFLVYNGDIVKKNVGEPHDGNIFYTQIDSLRSRYSKLEHH